MADASGLVPTPHWAAGPVHSGLPGCSELAMSRGCQGDKREQGVPTRVGVSGGPGCRTPVSLSSRLSTPLPASPSAQLPRAVRCLAFCWTGQSKAEQTLLCC